MRAWHCRSTAGTVLGRRGICLLLVCEEEEQWRPVGNTEATAKLSGCHGRGVQMQPKSLKQTPTLLFLPDAGSIIAHSVLHQESQNL